MSVEADQSKVTGVREEGVFVACVVDVTVTEVGGVTSAVTVTLRVLVDVLPAVSDAV